MENEIRNLLVDYLFQVTKEVKLEAENGNGRKILGKVINRPEDIDIEIDKTGERILDKLLKKYKIEATIFSEPENRDIKNGNSIYGAIDPFDGSVLFLKGFKHNWYTALSFYGKDKIPIATGISDILNEKFYIFDGKEIYTLNAKTGKMEKIAKSNQKDLSGSIVLASYIMSSQYSSKFIDIFGDLVRNLDPRAIFYPQGGSFIYAFLAAGLVDAYVMFDEPRSEIDPGFPIAKAAGCKVVAVDSNGFYKDYEFAPGRQHDKVNLLVASCTAELRDNLINHYIKKYAKRYSLSRVWAN